MAASFDIKFLVNRSTPLHQLQLTDTSTGFTLDKANFKITYPNGYVVENTDFTSPDISSAGATTPLVHHRQYKKNIGRTLKLKTVENEKYEAVLTAADTKEIVLEWKAREPKPIGKGKVTVQKMATIPYQNIEKAQVKLVF